MPKELSKAYEPQKYEDAIYKRWEESGFFAPEAHPPWADNPDNLSGDAGRYVNILPPPNANGEMHVGHASGYVVMDLLGRYHRMKGEKVLLLPGKDHAGIQTQVVYEKKIKKENGLSRHDLGRKKFYQDTYAFCLDRARYMRSQEKKIGLSADWSREKFTLDPNLLQVVFGTFVKMYNEVDASGRRMVYRGERIINWCPRCATALSDVELEHEEQTAKLYTFKYGPDFPIAISTSRPETKLGDTAVAVNPKDKRYKKYIGQEFVVKKFAGGPDLKIKIIGDESVDMNFGTGALGVTPAHAAVDWDMAQKNNLPVVKVINEKGKINSGFGQFSDLAVTEARALVVSTLKQNGLMEKEEDYANNLSVCERCRTPIEPLPSKQWFVNVDHDNFSLKKAAHRAVENDEIKIYPERFKKVMLDWIDNVHDWCISRQIWWGPRIPAWYCRGNDVGQCRPQCKNPIVAIEAPDGCPVCGSQDLEQDPDTFDTWFSSGQWAYSTLGYPDGKDFKEFYPNDVMIMGRDILPFWAFRMIILSLYRTGSIPFKNLYFTGLIRDEKGQKMSKSKGNGIEPIEMIKKYGTDAVRLSLLLGNTPGNDMNLGEEKIAGFRNFTNKLWNISRYIITVIASEAKQSNGDVGIAASPTAPRNDKMTLADKWILAKLNTVVAAVSRNIENYEFSQAGEILRQFTWGELADWYLEIAKIERGKEEILRYILETILKLWHPFMPFVTEQIWSEIFGADKMLMVSAWPSTVIPSEQSDEESLSGFPIIQSIITTIRSARAENKIEPSKKINAAISAGAKAELLNINSAIIAGLSGLEKLTIEQKITKPENAIVLVAGDLEIFLDLSGAVDMEKEKSRLAEELTEAEKYIGGLSAKLANAEFVKNAPPAVVEKEKQKLTESKQKLSKLKEQLNNLK